MTAVVVATYTYDWNTKTYKFRVLDPAKGDKVFPVTNKEGKIMDTYDLKLNQIDAYLTLKKPS